MDYGINLLGRAVTALQKAPKCPIAFLLLLDPLLNLLDVGFESHMTSSRKPEISGGD
jgi:hypothetical protein